MPLRVVIVPLLRLLVHTLLLPGHPAGVSCTAGGRGHAQKSLRLDEALIQKVKRISKKSGKSVSQMVSDYFSLIEQELDPDRQEITPRVRSLFGALAGAKVSEDLSLADKGRIQNALRGGVKYDGGGECLGLEPTCKALFV